MLKGILAISGQPGLFRMISESKNSVIVESLLTGKKSTAYASAKMSTLEDIAIYTINEDVPLKEVFKIIAEKENGGAAIDVKVSNDELKDYFETILPQFDKERVYASDIKKVITWYNLLQEKGLLKFEEEIVQEETTEKLVAEE
jgi:argininosuccinate lyase